MDAMKDFLKYLEERFEEEREAIVPIYAYDKKTNTISLPPQINRKLKRLVLKGSKVEAVKQVTRLTGAGLRLSKDYVDDLAKRKRQSVGNEGKRWSGPQTSLHYFLLQAVAQKITPRRIVSGWGLTKYDEYGPMRKSLVCR